MPVSYIQPTFAAGEIAPSLYARVDLAKYHAAAKLLRNFFVLPHGGVSNRAGTQFVGRCFNSAYPVHVIPFQFNLVQTYTLEFGHQYMRVIMNGGYVLETVVPWYNENGTQILNYTGIEIASITNANPGVVTVNYSQAPSGYTFKNGDQVYISGTNTALDSTPGRQYLVANYSNGSFNLTDLDGNLINTTNSGVYSLTTSYGTISRIFTLTTPYQGSDVQQIKWAQSNDTLTLCHPSYPPADLTRTQHWVWTYTPIGFAPTISPPTGLTVTADSTSGTQWNYSYVVTAISDAPPDESFASTPYGVTGSQLNSNTGVYNNISWTATEGASGYRVYKANPTVHEAIPTGAMYGYIGTANGTSFVDVEIAPDFTQAPPQGTNPFAEGSIKSVTVINGGSGYSSGTTLSVNDISGTGAVLTPTISGGAITAVAVANGGQDYQAPVVTPGGNGSGAAGHINVTTIFGQETVTVTMTNQGQDYFGTVKATVSTGSGCTFTPVIKNGAITGVSVSGTGTGYTDGEALTFTQETGTGATFSVVIAPAGNYPSCVTYFQQRKVFAGSNTNPQTLWMTKPADFKNMDVSNPSQSNDAIVATIAANQVNAIKWLVPMNNLLVMTSGGAWALMGGYITNPVAVTPSNIVVVPQSYNGCADLPPIVVNYDVLYVQAQGSIVRDLAYNFYAQVYTGTDMSILSNHLFYGHNLERWCYAEQPFYQIWAVRDDGILLSFTYLKEQDVYAWAHSDSPGNSGTDQFLSCASIVEQQVSGINASSVYFVAQRTIPGINGGQPVKYIERMTSRNFLTNGVADVTKAWFVDCGLQYSGTATSVISGLDHLNGATVSILADGSVQPQQVVSGGSINLQYPASRVTVGLPYVAQFQSLCMEPEGMSVQVQDYRKRISAVALRVTDTRGLKAGSNWNSLVEIKERGPGVFMGQPIPLFTGDERVVIDSQYLVDDDVCIQQDQPLPCTILGVIPEVSIGDTPG
jgi:hypothetical protein